MKRAEEHEVWPSLPPDRLRRLRAQRDQADRELRQDLEDEQRDIRQHVAGCMALGRWVAAYFMSYAEICIAASQCPLRLASSQDGATRTLADLLGLECLQQRDSEVGLVNTRSAVDIAAFLAGVRGVLEEVEEGRAEVGASSPVSRRLRQLREEAKMKHSQEKGAGFRAGRRWATWVASQDALARVSGLRGELAVTVDPAALLAEACLGRRDGDEPTPSAVMEAVLGEAEPSPSAIEGFAFGAADVLIRL